MRSRNVFHFTRRKSFRVFFPELALISVVTLHLQAIIHPDSGQKIPMPFRMSGTGSLATRGCGGGGCYQGGGACWEVGAEGERERLHGNLAGLLCR